MLTRNSHRYGETHRRRRVRIFHIVFEKKKHIRACTVQHTLLYERRVRMENSACYEIWTERRNNRTILYGNAYACVKRRIYFICIYTNARVQAFNTYEIFRLVPVSVVNGPLNNITCTYNTDIS